MYISYVHSNGSLYVQWTTDGTTWNTKKVTSSLVTNPSIALDGSHVYILYREPYNDYSVYIAISDDGGNTWRIVPIWERD